MKTALSLALALSLLAVPALAQNADAQRVRGTVGAFDGKTLTVTTRSGESVTLPLATHFGVTGVKPASLADIRAGSFIGTAAVPAGKDRLRALEVVVFPPEMKGAGEGHRPWDLVPESTMTNATVADTVTGVDGRTLKLTYKGGEQTVLVPDGTPIVAPTSAEASDLKPGAPVVVLTQRDAGNKVAAMRVIVGNHGVAPPM